MTAMKKIRSTGQRGAGPGRGLGMAMVLPMAAPLPTSPDHGLPRLLGGPFGDVAITGQGVQRGVNVGRFGRLRGHGKGRWPRWHRQEGRCRGPFETPGRTAVVRASRI